MGLERTDIGRGKGGEKKRRGKGKEGMRERGREGRGEVPLIFQNVGARLVV